MGKPAVIVTGAAGAMGRAICVELADAGFDLAICDLRSSALEQTARLAEEAGANVERMVLDLTATDTAASLVTRALAAFGRLDGLVNNAGVAAMQTGDVLDVSPASYDRCQAVNARAAFFLTQAAGRHFVSTEAKPNRFVATVTSSNATAISITRSEYCVSKAAASMVTQCFATRLAPHGVQVFEIRPGVIETEMTADRLDHYRRLIAEQNLVAEPRIGRPEDVARCIRTVAEGRLPYTVGQIINVDGGMISRRY